MQKEKFISGMNGHIVLSPGSGGLCFYSLYYMRLYYYFFDRMEE